MTESFYHSSTDFLSSSSTMASEPVMSPKTETTDDTNTAQTTPTTSRERAAYEPAVVIPPHTHARSAETDAIQKVLKMLGGMDERMKKMELSQASIDQDERMRGAVESGMFNSKLGAAFADKQHREALDWSDSRSHQVHRPAMDHPDGSRPRQHQLAPQRAQQLPQPSALLPPYQPMPQQQAPPASPMQTPAETQFRTPDARQRKLAIRKFDGTEVTSDMGPVSLTGGRPSGDKKT